MLVAGGIAVNAATALMFMRKRAHNLNIASVFTHMAGDARFRSASSSLRF
jgi:Co/Zn/Cd efflux system component